jgi:hypothetical protein
VMGRGHPLVDADHAHVRTRIHPLLRRGHAGGRQSVRLPELVRSDRPRDATSWIV